MQAYFKPGLIARYQLENIRLLAHYRSRLVVPALDATLLYMLFQFMKRLYQPFQTLQGRFNLTHAYDFGGKPQRSFKNKDRFPFPTPKPRLYHMLPGTVNQFDSRLPP